MSITAKEAKKTAYQYKEQAKKKRDKERQDLRIEYLSGKNPLFHNTLAEIDKEVIVASEKGELSCRVKIDYCNVLIPLLETNLKERGFYAHLNTYKGEFVVAFF